MLNRRTVFTILLAPLMATVACTSGWKSAGVTEVRGKNQFGPEFQHDGVKRSDQIRYYAGQQIEAKWENGWTTAVTYRYRAIDEGNGNQEQLVLFEVGYPIWKAPKKPDKTAMQIEELQKKVGELQSRLVRTNSQEASLPRLVETAGTDNGTTNEKENGYAQP